MYNPSLREEPRHQPAPIIPPKSESSILSWLEGTGRLIERDTVDQSLLDEDIDEINTALMGDDLDYSDDDLDDDLED